MLVLWVVPSLAVAVLLFSLAYGQMRKPAASGFLTSYMAVSVTAYLITAFLAFGLIGAALDYERIAAEILALPVTGKLALAAFALTSLAMTRLLMQPALRSRARMRTDADIIPLPPRGPSLTPGAPGTGSRNGKRAA